MRSLAENQDVAGLNKMPTGVEGFDAITGGGLPRNRTSLIFGGPGGGKTVLESTKKSGVECHRRGKSATVPFNRLILRGILRAVRPRAADTGRPTFWRSPVGPMEFSA